jgi:DNA gyrase subunit A
VGATGSFSIEDLIPDEEMVITVSHTGYIKRLPVDTYRMQHRGGRGIAGMGTKEEDWVEHLFLASTHDYLMFFTRNGQCYWLKVHEIPQGGRNSRGKPIVNLINIPADDKLAALVPVREFSPDRYLMFATRKGVVKKTVLSAYSNQRVTGINAINILEGEELIGVRLTEGSSDIVLATRGGLAIRFRESDVREMGRATTGVRGISLQEDDEVIGQVVLREGTTLLVVTERGMGKRTETEEYRLQRRGGKGVINVRTSPKTGRVVAIKEVRPGDELMIITRRGVVIRQGVDGVRLIGRNTQGVRLINLDPRDAVVDVACVVREEDSLPLEPGDEVVVEPLGGEAPA